MPKKPKSPRRGAPLPVRAAGSKPPTTTVAEVIPATAEESTSAHASIELKFPGLRFAAAWASERRRA